MFTRIQTECATSCFAAIAITKTAATESAVAISTAPHAIVADDQAATVTAQAVLGTDDFFAVNAGKAAPFRQQYKRTGCVVRGQRSVDDLKKV